MNSDQDHTQGTKKRALIATVAIFGSRILGLVREQVFAFFFGAGAVLDAYYVAFRIPNVLRDLAAEGALSQSFITVFSQLLAEGKSEEAQKLARKMTTFIVLVMGFVTILGIIFAPQITATIASGFTGEKYELTVRLMRILFPYIFFVSLAAFLMGILNSHKKFFIPFSASTFFNFISITLGLTCAYLFAPDYISQTFAKLMGHKVLSTTDYLAVANAISGMAVGTLIGGLGQYLFQIPSVIKLGYVPKLNFKLRDNTLFKVLKLTGPAIIAGAAVQVNVLINTEFASLLADGSVTYLTLSFRFMQFPLGIFGVAIAAASAPVLAQLIGQGKHTQFKETIQSSLQMSLFLTLPSMVGLIVLGRPIISLIYEHGHFNSNDTIQTTYALMAYAFGISSYALIKIYQPAFLAFHDAKTPMRISLFSILINVAVNSYFILVLELSHWALAAGTAIVAVINIVLLATYFRKKVPAIWTLPVIQNVMFSFLAALLMGVGVFYFNDYLAQQMSHTTLLNKCAHVFLPIALAVPLYLGFCLVFRVKDARFILNKLFIKRP